MSKNKKKKLRKRKKKQRDTLAHLLTESFMNEQNNDDDKDADIRVKIVDLGNACWRVRRNKRRRLR